MTPANAPLLVDDTTDMHRWLVMSGSGMKFYSFLGSALAFAERGYTFAGVTGTSGGAIAGGALSKYYDIDRPKDSMQECIDKALTIDVGRVLTFRWRIWEMLTTIWQDGPRGFIYTKGIEKALRKHMPATIGESRLPIRVCAYQVNSKSARPVRFAAPDVDLPKAVLGSMCLPGIEPVLYGPAMLQDGGWVRNLDLPKDKKHVIGMHFGVASTEGLTDTAAATTIETSNLIKIKTNLELLLRCIEGSIADNAVRSLVEAQENGVDVLQVAISTSMGGLDFFANKAKRMDCVEDGYQHTLAVLNDRQANASV